MDTPNTETQLAVTAPPAKPVLAGDRGLTFATMGDMWKFCTAVANSAEFKDIKTPEAALMRLQAGLELGLSPIWSLTNIMFTNGKPSVWGDGLLGIVLSQPTCEDVLETTTGKFPEDSYTARCEVRRKGRSAVVREFSVADAKKAGIFGKNVHATYPKRMLQMRARSWACRDAYADALRGLSVREEASDIVERPVNARVVSSVPLVMPGDAPQLPGASVEQVGEEAAPDPSLVPAADDLPWEDAQ